MMLYVVYSYDEYLDKFSTKEDAREYIRRLVDAGTYMRQDLKVYLVDPNPENS